MFLGIGRMQKPFSKKSAEPVEESAKQKKLAVGDTDVEDILVTQISSMEELVHKRTAELEEAKIQLQQLAHTEDGPPPTVEGLSQLIPTAGGSGKAKDETKVDALFTTPNQAEGKVAVPAVNKPPAVDSKLNAAVKEAGEKEKGSEQEAKGASDAATNFFSYEEEEDNPLSGLIASLPDVDTAELLREAHEIEKQIREWRAE